GRGQHGPQPPPPPGEDLSENNKKNKNPFSLSVLCYICVHMTANAPPITLAFTAVMRLSTIEPTGTFRSRIPTILPRLTGAFAIRARSQRPKKLKRITASTNAKRGGTARPTRYSESISQT